MQTSACEPKRIFCRPVESKALFGVSRSTFYRWIEKGKITVHKRGNTTLVRVEDVENYISGLGD